MVALFQKCSFSKLKSGVPTVFNIALVMYIMYVFCFKFVQEFYPEYSFWRLCIEFSVGFFGSMSIVFTLIIVVSDPGYLSHEYRHPLTEKGWAPLEQLRVYNMRHFIKNKLYDFSEQPADD